jgi:hypothetical protein
MIFLLGEQRCDLSLSLFPFSNQPLPATARYMRF